MISIPLFCRVKINGMAYDTADFHVTATPSGNVKLTCTVDLTQLP